MMTATHCMMGATIQLITLIGNDFNSNSELQITIRKTNMILPCPKWGAENVTHAFSEAHKFSKMVLKWRNHRL
jgi:hypothetical protein